MKTIGIVVGSLRKQSFNRCIAEHIASILPDGYKALFIDYSALGIYNQDLDETPPDSWVRFRDTVKSLDALLFVTPEYNRSIPGGLKNALDVGSRPYGQSAWSGKPGAIVSVSPGALGGFGSNHHLRQVLMFLNVFTLQQPEMYIGQVASVLDENGKVENENTRNYLKSFVDTFIKWIEKFRA